MNFEELHLIEPLLRAVREEGYTAPTPVQTLAIPFALVGTLASIGSLENGELPLTYTIATSLATLVSSTVVLPFTSGIVSLLYIDRRIRREALDIELARAAGLPG